MKNEKEWNKQEQEAFRRVWAKIVAKAWSDAAFKQRLIKDPRSVLKENGIELPPSIECKIDEDSEKVLHLVLPKKPSGELTEESLKKIAAAGGEGKCGGTCGGCGATAAR